MNSTPKGNAWAVHHITRSCTSLTTFAFTELDIGQTVVRWHSKAKQTERTADVISTCHAIVNLIVGAAAVIFCFRVSDEKNCFVLLPSARSFQGQRSFGSQATFSLGSDTLGRKTLCLLPHPLSRTRWRHPRHLALMTRCRATQRALRRDKLTQIHV